MRKAMKKIVVFTMALAILFTSNASLVEAKEADTNAGIVSEQSTTVVPLQDQDKSYTFSRSATSYQVGPVIVTDDSSLRLIMSNNGGKSYMQGNVSFSPMTGGNSIDIRFANYATEDYMVPMDNVPPGAYFLFISGAVTGSSGTARVRVIYKDIDK